MEDFVVLNVLTFFLGGGGGINQFFMGRKGSDFF